MDLPVLAFCNNALSYANVGQFQLGFEYLVYYLLVYASFDCPRVKLALFAS